MDDELFAQRVQDIEETMARKAAAKSKAKAKAPAKSKAKAKAKAKGKASSQSPLPAAFVRSRAFPQDPPTPSGRSTLELSQIPELD